MSHSQACKGANRSGDGFDCIGKPRCAHVSAIDDRHVRRADDCEPAPSPQPEMPEGTALFFLNEEAMREYLRSKGLHIVERDDPRLGFLDVNDMAEWLGEEPRRLHVIDAQQKAVLDAVRDGAVDNPGGVFAQLLSELARRRK